MRSGFRSAQRISGRSPNTSASPTASEVSTSAGVCTPRYIREKPTSATAAAQSQRSQRRDCVSATTPMSPVMFCVWPEGKL